MTIQKHACILHVARGTTNQVYRLELLDDGRARLQRFHAGTFVDGRSFAGEEGTEFSAHQQNTDKKLRAAVRHVARYLDGSVNVGERDLLSPSTALARNIRWFSGDLQMIYTALPYIRELFPSAQFHVGQLLRRIFGDFSFVALILLSSGLWLRSDGPAAFDTLTLTLQVLSLLAIIGLDRYWEPLCHRWNKLREIEWPGYRWQLIVRAPWIFAKGIVEGTFSVILHTVIGLSNLVIHPLRIWQSWRRLREGRAFSWKASSASAGQDMRGWPTEEFFDVYRPATLVGGIIAAFAVWLMLLGVPLQLLGINGLGVFVASFLTAAIWAWFAALPRSAVTGTPQYQLSRRDYWSVTTVGALGTGLSAILWQLGLYPIPAFDGAIGYIAWFLSGTALFALLYPTYYACSRFADGRFGVHSGRFRAAIQAAAVLAMLVVASGVVVAASGDLTLSALSRRAKQMFVLDASAWRMPEAERRVFDDIQATLRRHRNVDPQPLWRADGDQATLAAMALTDAPDLQELQGVPAPRLLDVVGVAKSDIPDLPPLPIDRRLASLKPKRSFLLPLGEDTQELVRPFLSGSRLQALAQQRARALHRRHLSAEELLSQAAFIEQAAYPWVGKDELSVLGAADAEGARLSLSELARAHRWEHIDTLWNEVEAATRGHESVRVQFDRLARGIEGVVALGQDPSADQVQRLVELELRLIEEWAHTYPRIPLTRLDDADAAHSRFHQLAVFALEHELDPNRVASELGLAYIDAYWNRPTSFPNLVAWFRDGRKDDPRERLSFDWGAHQRLSEQWETLSTQYRIARSIWDAGAPSDLEPTPGQLRYIVELLEGLVSEVVAGSDNPTQVPLIRLFPLEGIDAEGLSSKDPVAAALAAKLLVRTTASRIGALTHRLTTAQRVSASTSDQALLEKVAAARYPDHGGDARALRTLEWLIIIDYTTRHRELAEGYAAFIRDANERGIDIAGTLPTPSIEADQLTRDLLTLWRELPARYPALPVHEDLVAEFVAETAYFSSRNGTQPRTPKQFVDDFGDMFSTVERLMTEAPPEILERMANERLAEIQGRTSQSAAGRRFFTWWMVADQVRILEHHRRSQGVLADVNPRETAAEWAALIEEAQLKWPSLPWTRPGLSEYFLSVAAVTGMTQEALWVRFGRQLDTTAQLQRVHVKPFRGFVDLVDARIAQMTGSPSFDAQLREVNALLALSELLEAAQRNNINDYDARPEFLTRDITAFYEKVRRLYPNLHWRGQGIPEYYFLLGSKQHWDLGTLLGRFEAEWSLADALASRGVLDDFERIARGSRGRLDGSDVGVRRFIDAQARRLERKTKMHVKDPRTRGMNALTALAGLLVSSGEEGLLPHQHGRPQTRVEVEAWAKGLRGTVLNDSALRWAERLLADWGALHDAMVHHGPRFPWWRGSFVETHLLAMHAAGATVDGMQHGLHGAWRAASDLFDERLALAKDYVQEIEQRSKARLRIKIARARHIAPEHVPELDLQPDDPDLVHLNALLGVAEMTAEIRRKYGEDPRHEWLTSRYRELATQAAAEYPELPWSSQGFIPSLVVASYAPDFRDNLSKYTRFLHLEEIDRLLLEARRAQVGDDSFLPPEVLHDARKIMKETTHRTPASDRVVEYQALTDGAFLLREFLPNEPRTLQQVLTLLRLRTEVRRLDGHYGTLNILQTSEQEVRIGFADRLAAAAMGRALQTGVDPQSPDFVDTALALFQAEFLDSLSQIYAQVRATLSPEELDYYRANIAFEARHENVRRARKTGLSATSLSVPEVEADDIVTDIALYEILYAAELGYRGREQITYLSDLFSILEHIQAKPQLRQWHAAQLRAIDAEVQGVARSPGDPEYQAWLDSPAHAQWWERRGDFIKGARGRWVALARAFALVKQRAFASTAEPDAHRAFARFGTLEAYLDNFLDDYVRLRELSGLEEALAIAEDEDPYLAGGVQFALTLFKCHVVDRLYPQEEHGWAVMAGIASLLPQIQGEYDTVLGFSPRLESGVALFDARRAFDRATLQGGVGLGVLRRHALVERNVQRWTDTHLLKHAYKVLFYRELDEEDPTPISRTPSTVVPGLTRLMDRVWPRTLGEEVTEFLERRLPERLAAETGTHDPSVWIQWLIDHGEIGLDGLPTQRNPYAEDVASYEGRLEDYRQRVDARRRAGQSVRAQEQRIRDLELEYGSLTRQVAALHRAAAEAMTSQHRVRRDYQEAIWLHAMPMLVLLLCILIVLHITASNLWMVRLRFLLLMIPLFLGVALPLWVASSPVEAHRAAGGALRTLRLLDREAQDVRPRGAAAALARLRPWDVFAGISSLPNEGERKASLR